MRHAGEAGDGGKVASPHSGGASPSHPLHGQAPTRAGTAEWWAEKFEANSESYALGVIFSSLVSTRDDMRRALAVIPKGRKTAHAEVILEQRLDFIDKVIVAAVQAFPSLAIGNRL